MNALMRTICDGAPVVQANYGKPEPTGHGSSAFAIREPNQTWVGLQDALRPYSALQLCIGRFVTLGPAGNLFVFVIASRKVGCEASSKL